MTTLQKLYRKDLTEDQINVIGLFKDNEWKYQKESVPLLQIKNLSTCAVVIGNGNSIHDFDLTTILPYREITAWGEVGPWIHKRQRRNFFTYGCNAIYRNFKPDFVIATGNDFIKEIAESDYCTGNFVYANSKHLESYPHKFNFIPQNPEFNAGAIAAYLAAFDGHKKVFMLGFDGVDNSTDNYNAFADTPNYPAKNDPISEEYWNRSLNAVMKTYNDTEFIRVCPSASFRQIDSWRYHANYRQIDFRRFVLEADV